MAQTCQLCLRLVMELWRNGQVAAPVKPPIKKAMAASSNGGMLPASVVSKARKAQVRMAQKPIAVAVLELKDLTFPVDGKVN